ncbi:hypothetical protein [Acetatifactor aquisgranensis]|uniref:hypothetical protein n=1 Tax=Acetatifactor aquisgranensis TaxID=2941233 RepID=UPI00203ED67F|nr:hypothetical protein [Acetatifactor aquisgranensis]
MLGIVLKILSILGIVLLAVLGLLLLMMLLVFFFPFTYRVCGSKDAENLRLTAKVNWLFGLFRVRLGYPEPGRLIAKVLWFSLLDMGIPPKKEDFLPRDKAGSSKGADKKSGKTTADSSSSSRIGGGKAERMERDHSMEKDHPMEEDHSMEEAQEHSDASGSVTASANTETETPPADSGASQAETGKEETHSTELPPDGATGFFGKILQKIQRIKYTIYNIYDKIKRIWENISYYIELLQEENTKQLASHAFFRARKIFKSVRPRRVKVRLLFGTGSPDTTGYLYGAYCMLSAPLGPGFLLEPDFEFKRLEGEFDIAGHVMVWAFVINGLKLLLDKKLRLFLKQLKKGRKKLQKAPT